LGETSTTPEADAIDQLISAVWTNRSPNTLASAKALAVIQHVLAQAKADGDDGTLEMYYGSMVGHGGPLTKVCLSTDESGPMLFELTGRPGSYYVTSAKQFPNAKDGQSKCDAGVRQ
jgi:hypothetical protein